MIFLGFSPYVIFTSFLITLLLDRGVFANGNKQQITSTSPRQPTGSSPETAKASNHESEALKKVLPLVTFDCRGKTGYFTDSKFNCEVFHYCQPDGARNTFHCPSHQLFNQLSLVCEEKTIHNSRLCKEGSINSKIQKFSSNKKHDASQKASPIFKPSINSNSSADPSKRMMTLEDLLGYMNSGQPGKEKEPTFISRFHNADESRVSKKPSNSAITTPSSGSKSVTEKPSTVSPDVQLSAQGSDHSYSVTRTSFKPGTNSKRTPDTDDDVSAEYDAIEGRKPKKQKRVGRVLENRESQQPQKNKSHSQKSIRSTTNKPRVDGSTLQPTEYVEYKDSTSPSLFTADRNKAREFRKRKRYQGRKRKNPTQAPGNDTEISTVSVSFSTTMNTQTSKHDLETLRNNAYRRRKSQRPRTREGYQTSAKPEKVEPYTLPPLPTPTEDKTEVTTESMHRTEKKRDPLKEGRTKNPWHKHRIIQADDAENLKYGEKLSDSDQPNYQSEAEMVEGLAEPMDFYGKKDVPNTSDELISQEYKERPLVHSKSPNSGDGRSNYKSKVKNLKKLAQEESSKYGTHHHIVAPQNLFPPPRPEAREHHSTTPQQAIYESSHEKSKAEQNHYKVTTEDPFRVTHPYLDKYQPGVQELRDLEEQRWKIDSEKKKSKDKKVAVGSTFFFQSSATPETTQKPTLQAPPETEAPIISHHKEKDASKHTLAHQHLSKIMNDFFAMSSPNSPVAHSHKEKELIIPGYRIPDEDIYTASESSTEEDEEIPQELLEVVDLITGHVNEKSDLKPQGSHEVIKINGPITDTHLEKIFLDDKSDEYSDHEISADGSFRKIVVVPQSDDKEDDIKEIAEMAEFTSLKLEPLLKQISDEKSLAMRLEPILKEISDEKSLTMKLEHILKEISDEKSLTMKLEPILKEISDEKSLAVNLEPILKQIANDKSLTVIPLKTEPDVKPQPTVLTAKKLPFRVIYRDQLTNSASSKPRAHSPNIKIIQPHLQAPRLQQTPNGRRPTFRPISHSFGHTRPSVILHPPSVYPPHPPPLHRKQLPFRVGYPFVSNSRPLMQNMKHVPRRRKRSIISRLRRQIRQNKHLLPFSGAVFPAFNPKFVPTFSPFKSLLSPASLHTAGSHLTPFAFPGLHLAKPSQNRPHIFQPPHPRPPPVRHVSQTGHQTVIVEEVPVPIHVEVPSPNLMRPASSGSHPAKLPPRYPENQFRNPSPPAIQTPPLIQRPQGRFPPPPNNYRHFGMPTSIRPPAINYQPPAPFSPPLPASITNQGQLYALGVTNKPLLPPPKSRPARPPSGPLSNSPRNPPRPYNPFEIHATGYPNFPYFQGAFTTPISHEPVVGRLMYSGYKPPKSTLGTKTPKVSTPSNKDRKTSEGKSNRPKSKPAVDYFELPKPLRESHVSYTEEVISRAKPRTKSNSENYSSITDKKSSVQSLTKSTGSSSEPVSRKRKPNRRRRPRPHSTTTQGTTSGSSVNEISPTPPPPEQIPPPPADYTSKPAHHDIINSLPSISEGTKTYETSSHFPPAGYYGKDQLVQFFETSSKSHQKATSPRPYHAKNLGESVSSAELDEMSISSENGNEPAFGTRLRSRSQTQSRSRQSKNKQPVRSQTQNTEVRTRPNKPDEISDKRKEVKLSKPNEGGRMPVRAEKPPPRRRRPPPPRPRSRPSAVLAPQPEIHHFKFNENVGNFYSVPRGLQNLVAPSVRPQQTFQGSRDMFGIPHPVIDPNIYSLRPQGAPVEFDQNFFSVPAHVAQQQQSPLRKMNLKPIPDSAREFFSAPDAGVSAIPEASAPEKQESEQRSPPNNPAKDNKEQDKPVRKLRKPKRKNRYNPHSNEQKDSVEVNSAKPQTELTTTRESNPVRFKEKITTFATTTAEPRSTSTVSFHSQNDIKESPVVFKQRTPFLPKSLPEISKSLLNGKIDIQKLNATISTSVSVSGAIPQTNNTSSEEKDNKRVFSSQNGGLAVVRKGPKRKRARQRISTTTGVPYLNNDESSTDAKYEIAASVLDIIKATTETERQASGYYNNDKASSRVTNPWIESPSNKRH